MSIEGWLMVICIERITGQRAAFGGFLAAR
jgi:hypothetical protein